MTIEEAIERYTSNAEYERTHGNLQGCLEFRQLAEWLKDYKRLKEQEPCEDAISRQVVLEAIDDDNRNGHYSCFATNNDAECFKQIIRELPSVTAQPKIGYWEWLQYDGNPKIGNWHCSKCGCIVVEAVDKNKKGGIPLYKYCPQCGCKLQEVEEC